ACKGAPRVMCKRYNTPKYSYRKLSVLVDEKTYGILQTRARDLMISVSLLADMAVKLYLRRVVQKIVASVSAEAIPLRKILRGPVLKRLKAVKMQILPAHYKMNWRPYL